MKKSPVGELRAERRKLSEHIYQGEHWIARLEQELASFRDRVGYFSRERERIDAEIERALMAECAPGRRGVPMSALLPPMDDLPADPAERGQALHAAAAQILAALMAPVEPGAILTSDAHVSVDVRRGVLKQALLWEAAWREHEIFLAELTQQVAA